MNEFDLQRKAIRYAIKMLEMEKITAQRENDNDWVKDCETHILYLDKALDTIEAMKALSKVFQTNGEN